MKSKWLVYAKKADFKAIEQKYGIDQVIARIMRNRDVCTDEEMQMYLNGSIDGLHAPELLKDAQDGEIQESDYFYASFDEMYQTMKSDYTKATGLEWEGY
jgi:hypothetical protein